MKLLAPIAIAAAIAAGGCSTLQVNTDYDPATNFAAYKTFTIRQGAESKDTFVVERFRGAVSAALTARGLAPAEGNADLLVFTHFKLGKETQLNTYGYGGWYGWRWGGGGYQTTTVEQIPVGTVVVDLVDTKTNKAVWRGIAKDQISQNATPEERQQKANEVAKVLFENFPPSSKK